MWQIKKPWNLNIYIYIYIYIIWQNYYVAKSLWTLTSSTLPLWTVTVWSTLQSSEHQNDQTQEQSLPSGNPSHEHLTMIMVHTLFIYLTHILSLHFKLHIIYLYIQNSPLLYTCTYNCQFVYCYSLFTCSFSFLFLLFVFFCSVTVILLHCGSFCHKNKFLVGVNTWK